jgi:hypothetical protein
MYIDNSDRVFAVMHLNFAVKLNIYAKIIMSMTPSKYLTAGSFASSSVLMPMDMLFLLDINL